MLHQEHIRARDRGLDDLRANAQGASRGEAVSGLHVDRARTRAQATDQPRHARHLDAVRVAVHDHRHLIGAVAAHVDIDVAPDVHRQAGATRAARHRHRDLGHLFEGRVAVVPHAVVYAQDQVGPVHAEDHAVRVRSAAAQGHERSGGARRGLDPKGQRQGLHDLARQVLDPAHHRIGGGPHDGLVREEASLQRATLKIEVQDTVRRALVGKDADRVELQVGVLVARREDALGLD